MKPKHVKSLKTLYLIQSILKRIKRKGMNNKDLDFMAEKPLLWAVIVPKSIFVIGIGETSCLLLQC